MLIFPGHGDKTRLSHHGIQLQLVKKIKSVNKCLHGAIPTSAIAAAAEMHSSLALPHPVFFCLVLWKEVESSQVLTHSGRVKL